jgi:succinate dehydrogenase / fumarate reductase cytochrome b subunit
MMRVKSILASSVGLKVAMASSGLLLGAWLFLHMAGNLAVFKGQQAMNAYARFLKHDLTLLLWLTRAGLVALLAVHVAAGVQLVKRNRGARPHRYVCEDTVEASFASRSMFLSGAVVLAFVVYHLLHFTFGATHPAHFALRDAGGRHDVYSMVVLGFRSPYVTASYIVALLLLGLHLSHGAASLFRTLGLDSLRCRRTLRGLGWTVTLVIVAGFLAVPLCVLVGVVGGEVSLPAGGGN